MKINNLAVLGLSFFGSVVAVFDERDFTHVDDCDALVSTNPDQCCSTVTSCIMTNNGVERTIVVPKGSCVGGVACAQIGYLTLGEQSCRGSGACSNAAHFSSIAKIGTANIGSHSCRGVMACTEVGKEGEVTIGSGSCLGDETATAAQQTCTGAGRNSSPSTVVIGDGSCFGKLACFQFGHSLLASSIIGNGSCDGEMACMYATLGSGAGGIAIGDGSCNGDKACMELGVSKPRIIIGSNSCNCPGCCRCLKGINVEIVIPDNSCNSLGEGLNQCCLDAAGSRNSAFDLSNTDSGIVTEPSPPGSSTTTTIVGPPVYDIELVSCAFVTATDAIDVGDITCSFTASGGVGHTIESQIMDDDCTSTFTQTGVVQDANPTFVAELDDGSTTQQGSTYDVVISLDYSAVQSDDIAFCLLTSVLDVERDSYAAIGQRIRLPVNIDGTFNTDGLTTEVAEVSTEEAAETGQANFLVTAKRCDTDGNEVTKDTELSVGENFFLCVNGSQNVVISGIQELVATKNNVVDVILVTSTGAGSEGTNNANTFVYGKDTNQIIIATRIPSRFFQGTGSITLTGAANIGVGGRRRLVRLMQETSTSEESSDFSTEIPIVASPMFETAGGSTKGRVGVLLLAVAAAVALFV